MSYIYDIALNFQDEYYDFYEWNKKDKIINIKKTTVLKISESNYLSFKNNIVKVDKSFLDNIEKNPKDNNYITLITNGKTSMGIMLDEEGNLIKRSGLLFDEADEAVDFYREIKEVEVGYIINKKQIRNNFKARTILLKEKYITSFLNNEKNINTLKYLYYDYFEKESTSDKTIKIDLLNEINKPWNNKQNKLYSAIKLLNSKKV